MAQRLNYNAARQSRSRPPPRPLPLALYNFKAPNGVRFPRPIFLRESGSCETLEDSCAPLFCGNQDSRETRKDSGAAFFAAKRFQRITATFQRRTWKVPAAHYFAGIRIPARHGRIPALHFLRQKDPSASQQHSSAAPGNFQRPIILRE